VANCCISDPSLHGSECVGDSPRCSLDYFMIHNNTGVVAGPTVPLPRNFNLSEMFLFEKFSPKIQNLVLKISYLVGFGNKFGIFEHTSICPLLEICRAVCWNQSCQIGWTSASWLLLAPYNLALAPCLLATFWTTFWITGNHRATYKKFICGDFLCVLGAMTFKKSRNRGRSIATYCLLPRVLLYSNYIMVC